MNTFILAYTLPPSIQKEIARLCYGLPHVDWVEEHSLHIVLRTIRHADASLSLDLQESLAQIKPSKHTLQLQGINCNYSKSQGGSIWIALASQQSLEYTFKEVDRILKDVPGEKSDRSKPPRVILGYFKSLSDQRLANYLEAHAMYSSPPFDVQKLVLYEFHAPSKSACGFYKQLL